MSTEQDIPYMSLDRYCFCCERIRKKPIGIEGVCEECEKNQRWYETGTHGVHEKLVVSNTDIRQVVQILPHGKGWIVNGQKIER